MIRHRPWTRIALSAALSAACVANAAPDTFEDYTAVPIDQVLPANLLRSADFSLGTHASADDGFYRFAVATEHGQYDVTSLAMLRRRLHEIVTIAHWHPAAGDRRVEWERKPGGRRGVGSEDVVDILADPVTTAAHLLDNLQYNLVATLSPGAAREERAATDNSEPPAATPAPDPHRRNVAARLGVDVYSSNPALQNLLDRLAREHSGGERTNTFSPLIRDIFAEPAFGTGVLQQRVESRLKNTPSEDVNADVLATLAGLGVAAPERIGFLTHRAYTPRTRLYVATYLDLLADVDHVERLLEATLAARTEADALAYVAYLRMLAYFQVTEGGLRAVVTKHRFPTLATVDGDAVLALPLDYLAWTSAVSEAAGAMHDIRTAAALGRFIVVLAGHTTPRAQQAFAARGIEVYSRYSY